MPDPITRIVARGLAAQDPDAPHSLLTRLLVSAIIVFAMVVLYGFYGVIGAVVVYLIGVELAGLDLRWLYLPIVFALLLALRRAAGMLADYWGNFGH